MKLFPFPLEFKIGYDSLAKLNSIAKCEYDTIKGMKRPSGYKMVYRLALVSFNNLPFINFSLDHT